ncbi:MAG: hypothetical protein ACUVTR_06420 [Dehalococcoidia bacterium]
MAKPGRAGENIKESWYQRFPGIMDAPEGLVRCVNTLKEDTTKNNPPQ